MVFFALGVLALLVLMGALGAFSRAQVASIKQFGLWTVAIGGLLLSVLLLFTRGPAGLSALILLGPLLWSYIGQARQAAGRGAGPGGPGPRPRQASAGRMTRAEAYDVLGLKPGASEAEIRTAYHRLMRGAHPDVGGSEWLASCINQARDVLLS